jgi:outer membrane protein assembly factor BamB
VDFSGEISGDKAAGITIFDHSDNLRHPSPWYVEKGMPYFSPAVLFDKAYTIAGGKSLTLRYRILIHPGLADKARLEAEWKAFLKTTDLEVRMESAKKLFALGRAMALYSGDYDVKFPDDMRAFHKYGNVPLKKKDLEWLLENVVYLGKGKTDGTIQRNTVLAYDKVLLEEGEGTNVLFGDLRIDFLRTEQLKMLGIKPGHETDVQHESAEKLRQLALAALMYADDHKGKFAADLNKLKPYLGKEKLFEWIVENVEYIGQGKMTDVRRPQRRAVAYDRTLLGKGYGTYVAFTDGHVEFLHPKQVEKLSVKPGQNWPCFRGSSASGVVEGYPTPVKWDVEGGENVLWKTPVAGLGHSCPAVWGERIFVTTAVKGKGESSLKVGMYGDVKSIKEKDVFSWRVYCIDRKSGKILWEREAYTGRPKVKRHPKSSHANATPCTDGKYVIAFFGSEGLYCYDMQGNPIWEKDLGVLDWGFYRARSAQWGGGSSPIIHKEMVILQCDVQKNSFIAAFNLKDGEQLWKTPRSDVPTWGTPTVYTGKQYSQIIVNGYRHIGGYDIETGKEIWTMKGGGDIPVPTPVVGHGLVYITNAHGRMSPIYAVRLSAAGDISLAENSSSNEHIAWSYSRGGNYMPTPIVYGDYLYCGSDSGRLSCFEAKTGKLVYRESLSDKRGAFSASPVAADGKIYFTGEKGDIYVVKAGPEFKLLGVNEMNETCMATPAISQGTLFFRTRHHLIAIAEEK